MMICEVCRALYTAGERISRMLELRGCWLHAYITYNAGYNVLGDRVFEDSDFGDSVLNRSFLACQELQVLRICWQLLHWTGGDKILWYDRYVVTGYERHVIEIDDGASEEVKIVLIQLLYNTQFFFFLSNANTQLQKGERPLLLCSWLLSKR